VGGLLVLASIGAFGWGLYNLIGTESCGTPTTDACSSETGLHILAVVAAPFVGGFGALLFVFRGGRMRWRSEKRVADMVARGEMAPPPVARPSTPAPVLPDGPPATWPGWTAKPEPDESPIDRLLKLDELKEKGLISAADYESQKKRILGGV
jgi:hypothetical protein